MLFNIYPISVRPFFKQKARYPNASWAVFAFANCVYGVYNDDVGLETAEPM